MVIHSDPGMGWRVSINWDIAHIILSYSPLGIDLIWLCTKYAKVPKLLLKANVDLT
jgi:hypothetical protein